jgi:23S rRNA pseudouridine1911/1915/1917 synthase
MGNSISDWTLYEDENVLVINKPAGLMVQGDGKTNEKTLADFILEKYPEMKEVGEPVIISDLKNNKEVKIYRPGIVHRLDKETSGVLVIAKNQKSFLFLKEQFQKRTMKKIYKAFVWGFVKNDEGTIDAPIARSKNDFRMWSAMRGIRGEKRDAVTQYKVLARFENNKEKFSFIDVYPKTGRTHQIRAHLKYINNPIVSDSLYTSSKPYALGFNRVALHAYSLQFSLEDRKKLKITAPLPDDFEEAFKLVESEE